MLLQSMYIFISNVAWSIIVAMSCKENNLNDKSMLFSCYHLKFISYLHFSECMDLLFLLMLVSLSDILRTKHKIILPKLITFDYYMRVFLDFSSSQLTSYFFFFLYKRTNPL